MFLSSSTSIGDKRGNALFERLASERTRGGSSETIGPYQGCPEKDGRVSLLLSCGAVLIGPFEGRRGRDGCGGLWGLNPGSPVLRGDRHSTAS